MHTFYVWSECGGYRGYCAVYSLYTSFHQSLFLLTHDRESS